MDFDTSNMKYKKRTINGRHGSVNYNALSKSPLRQDSVGKILATNNSLERSHSVKPDDIQIDQVQLQNQFQKRLEEVDRNKRSHGYYNSKVPIQDDQHPNYVHKAKGLDQMKDEWSKIGKLQIDMSRKESELKNHRIQQSEKIHKKELKEQIASNKKNT